MSKAAGEGVLTNLEQRHAARTKLMMKFWSAMHLAGIPKEQEWEAQEKISVEALAEILREAGSRKDARRK